jgi:hypothetical protein
MWKKITQTSNKVVPEEEVKPWKKKKRHTTVVRASKTMSNQEFLAVAVMGSFQLLDLIITELKSHMTR